MQRAFGATAAPHALSRFRSVVWCNTAFAELFGYSVGELENKSLSMLYPTTDDFASIGRKGLKLMRETPQYNDERMMMRKDGSVFWVRARGVSLTPQEPFALAVWNFEDIPRKARDIAELAPRQREIAAMLAEGLSGVQIAQRLNISRRTVEAHRANIMKRMNIRSVVELVCHFCDKGHEPTEF